MDYIKLKHGNDNYKKRLERTKNDTYIEKIELEGIHRRYNLKVEFNKSLNILYGQNGTGKSTLIHIISNLANCDFIRFAFIEFKRIRILYSSGVEIILTQEAIPDSIDKRIVVSVPCGEPLVFTKSQAMDEIRDTEDERYGSVAVSGIQMALMDFIEKNDLDQIAASYFPAFRTMLEAWSSRKEGRVFNSSSRKVNITSFARELFGPFLPNINYPSPLEIEKKLHDEVRDCEVSIARYESSIFSTSFIKVFSSLVKDTDNELDPTELLQEISQLTKDSTSNRLGGVQEHSDIYGSLRRYVTASKSSPLQKSASGALKVYRDALKERRDFQEKAFDTVNSYFDVVNFFLDKKKLSYELDRVRKGPRVRLKFPDGSWSRIMVMSSGERQLLTMLYAVNKMSQFSTVLIDEPEISLHIDWQEELLGKMMEQLGDRQIIVCTHSPSIAADFDEYMKEIAPDFIDSDLKSEDLNLTHEDEDEDEDEHQ